MRRIPSLFALITLIPFLASPPARASDRTAPVPIEIAPYRITFAFGPAPEDTLKIPYLRNHPLKDSHPGFTRAVVIVHGSTRDAEGYFHALEDAAELAGQAQNHTLLIAPQFLIEMDLDAASSLDDILLFWENGVEDPHSWKVGRKSLGTANHERLHHLSSFAVLDTILYRLAHRNSDLDTIVVVGHSAGGQFTNRYAAGNQMANELQISHPDLHIRYVVMNPSIYLYFTDERRVDSTLDEFAPAASGYNKYPYGLGWNLCDYLTGVGVDAIRAQYTLRDVRYLIGEEDTGKRSLVVTDAAMAQGNHRRERGRVYYNHLVRMGYHSYGDETEFVVPGLGHDGVAMTKSPCARYLLFDHGECTTPSVVRLAAPGSPASIQEIVDEVPGGTTILLGDGRFLGEGNRDIRLRGKPISLRSESGDPRDCVIDAQEAKRVFRLIGQESFETRIKDITIANGWIEGDGGGMACFFDGCSVSVRNCIFLDNDAGWDGGGLWCGTGAEPVLVNCTFLNNGAGGTGGGVHTDPGARITLLGTIIANSKSGAAFFPGESPHFLRCCNFFGNAGGDWVYSIQDSLGDHGNISKEPLFCLPPTDLGLCDDSPCGIPAAECAPVIGAVAIDCDSCGSYVCCDFGECHLVHSHAECMFLGGTWDPLEHACTPNNPCPQPHPCCFADGACDEMLSDIECQDAGGIWHAEWEACVPVNPCPQLHACCYQDATCAETVSETECLNGGGAWHPEWDDCDPNPCPLPQGACCNLTTGICRLSIEPECDGPDEWWDGASEVCDPNPCPQPPVRACCYGGHCVLTIEVNCVGDDQIWHPDESTCQPNPCEAVCCTGLACERLTEEDCAGTWFPNELWCEPDNPCPAACCFGGYCELLSNETCRLRGGDWLADISSCDPNPCRAVCCAAGHCVVTVEDSCAGQSGHWWDPDRTTCFPNPCPAACCTGTSCAFLTETECAGIEDSEWFIDEGSCNPNPCPAVCCLPDASCNDAMSEGDCEAAGGTWHRNLDSCDPDPCNPPGGAVCCVGEDCFLTSWEDCRYSLGGAWHPEYDSCEPNPCAELMEAVCCYDSGSCAVVTGFECSALGGTWHEGSTACWPNPCYHVIYPDTTGGRPTLQSAIDAAGCGEVIVLSSGTYDLLIHRDSETGGITYRGKRIEISSTAADPDSCVLDCRGVGRGFYFNEGEGNGSILRGITIKDGVGSYGGGVLCDWEFAASPTIENCKFVGNAANQAGGGLCGRGASHPLVIDCVFAANFAGSRGGGICCDPDDYGIAGLDLLGCTFCGNTAAEGAALFCGSSASSCWIDRALIAYSTTGGAIRCSGPAVPTISCSNIYGNVDGDWDGPIADQLGMNGNLADDPWFCLPPGDLRLCAHSPCLPENNACGVQIGARGEGDDCCVPDADLAGGVLIAHVPPGCEYSEGVDGCQRYWDEFEITSCEEQHNRIDPESMASALWYVIAAWSEEKEWQTIQFGLGDYDPELCAFWPHEYGPCFSSLGTEIHTPGWPGPNTGVVLGASDVPWSGNYVPVYWFGGYAYEYYGSSTLPLAMHPDYGSAGMGSCQMRYSLSPFFMYPTRTVDVECLGALGIDTDGVSCCPEPPASAACCANGNCLILTGEQCAAAGGLWHASWTSCDPNPCPPTPDSLNLSQSLADVWMSDAAWGDFDGDGDLDLVLCGSLEGNAVTRTYENQEGSLVFHQDLTGVQNLGSGCLAWGDYDGDGDLDLAIAGSATSASMCITRIYENNGTGTLTWDESQELTGLAYASLAWGDVDGDGDLDLLTMGYDAANDRAILYQNEPLGTLTEDPDTELQGLSPGSVDWVDLDQDGDLDLLLTGCDSETVPRTVFYLNAPPGTLTADGDHGLPGLCMSDAAWGDYDADGDLDLVITGRDEAGAGLARIYRNTGAGSLEPFGENLMPAEGSSCAWGDFDNDGDLDVAICGYASTGSQTRVFLNTPVGFTEAGVDLEGLWEGALAWADVDGDADLDLLATGASASGAVARIYEKVGGAPNTPPTPPTNQAGQAGASTIRLTWSGALDAETAASGLTYCLRVGTSSGNHDVVPGTYGSPLMGNVGPATALTLSVPQGTYYWSVRSIDSGCIASAWSAEQACPPAELACCVGEGCILATEANCLDAGGIWAPAWDRCNPNPCIPLKDWADHDVGNCVLSMTDQGTLGFLDESQAEGSGLLYPWNGRNRLLIGGLWVGQSEAYVANRDYDADPEAEWRVSVSPDGHVWIDEEGTSHQDIHASYTDSAAAEPRGLFVDQESWVYGMNSVARDFAMVHYSICNRGASALSDLYVGCFVDFNVGIDSTLDRGGVDAARNLVYMADSAGTHVGVSLLTGEEAPPVANLTLIPNPVHVWPQGYILDADKHRFLTAADGYVVTDPDSAADYSVLASAGPIDLAPDESRRISFVIAGGADLADLELHVHVAHMIHAGGFTDVPEVDLDDGVRFTSLRSNAPNPFTRETLVRFDLASAGEVRVEIFDPSGRLVRRLAGGQWAAGRYALVWDGRNESRQPVSSGVYLLRLAAGDTRTSRRIVLLR